MIVPGSAHALLLASLAGYQIPYSLRFRASNSAYLTRTPSAADATRTKASISIWLKRGALGGRSSIYAINSAGSAGASNQITMIFDNAGSNGDNLTYNNGSVNRTSTSVYRDPSAWYNLCQIFDTTQATAADRVKTYINGVLLTDINIGQDFTLNSNTPFGQSGVTEYIGRRDSGLYYDGYMAEIVFVVGQALTPSSFGQTDATTGVWVPKQYAGTYGTNGFYLKFNDATTTTTIGNDSSGNANNFTTSGISVTSGVTFDQITDTPTLNYAVLNPLDLSGTAGTYSAANLNYTKAAGGNAQAYSSITMASGKWYCEVTMGADIAEFVPGIIAGSANAGANRYLGQDSFTYAYYYDGRKINSASFSAYGNSYVSGDVIGIILDADNGKLYFSKNGTVQASGDPVAGTNAAFTGLTGPYRFAVSAESSGIGDFNFGQRAFAYTPPSGFKALNTANLPTPSIKKGSLYMDATLRTGTGATASVSSLNFLPDLVWIKSRSAATDHGLYDAVRGVQKQLESNTTTAETTETTGLTAFNSNGYTVGALAQLNTNTATYVDWAWKEGATPGFDIVTWTADGTSPRNISHSLGAVPKLIITKQRSPNAENWFTYHASLGATKNVRLDETAAAATQTGAWNDTAPTSTQFTTGNFANFTTNGNTLVAYLWSEIEGFSKFGSYTGNASADGPFVWCGFRPRYILFKNATSAGNNWLTFDTARDPYNLTQNKVAANSANSENDVAISGVSENNLDILSNGFKLRTSNAQNNGSGSTIIFAAFAENPFKYARAR
jgi:hypothetical protein